MDVVGWTLPEQTDYLGWVRSEVLAPMGIDASVFSPVPDVEDAATLSYSAEDPYLAGHFWPEMQCVGPGGWIASAESVAAYLSGLRNSGVLDSRYLGFMTRRLLGWYPGATSYGLGYHHNGGLTHTDDSGTTGISTGAVLFPDGYEAALVANTHVPDIIGLMYEAFDA